MTNKIENYNKLIDSAGTNLIEFKVNSENFDIEISDGDGNWDVCNLEIEYKNNKNTSGNIRISFLSEDDNEIRFISIIDREVLKNIINTLIKEDGDLLNAE